jgi:hypothetical protein
MKCISSAIAFGAVLLLGMTAGAEDQIIQAPQDGWWIRYFSTTKQEANGMVQEYTSQSTYSLVGTTMEDGEKFRWVEVNMVTSIGEKKHEVLWKYLIAEKDLMASERPNDKVKRGWVKSNDLEVRAIEAGKNVSSASTTLLIFPGMWQKAKLIENNRVVDYQSGRLTIPHARTLSTKEPINMNRAFRSQKGIRTVAVDYTIWLDPASSPVFSAAKISSKVYNNDQLNSSREDDMVIEDTGTDAVSKLPDYK